NPRGADGEAPRTVAGSFRSPCGSSGKTAKPREPNAPPKTLDWAELLRRTFAVDILQCHLCGGHRRVLGCVTGKAATQMLEHLGIPSKPPTLALARGPPEPWLQ